MAFLFDLSLRPPSSRDHFPSPPHADVSDSASFSVLFSHAQVVDGGGRHLVLLKFARAGVNITRGHGQSSVRQEPDEVTRASTCFPRVRLSFFFVCTYFRPVCFLFLRCAVPREIYRHLVVGFSFSCPPELRVRVQLTTISPGMSGYGHSFNSNGYRC